MPICTTPRKRTRPTPRESSARWPHAKGSASAAAARFPAITDGIASPDASGRRRRIVRPKKTPERTATRFPASAPGSSRPTKKSDMPTSARPTAAALALPFAWGHLALDSRGVGLVLFLGVVQMGISYVLFVRGLRVVPAAEASLIGMLEPMFNPLWAFLGPVSYTHLRA